MKKLLFISTLILYSRCGEIPAEETELQNSVATIPVSMLDKEQPGELERSQIISLQGLVDIHPNNDWSIQPYFEGFVKDIQVIEGSKVNKGDLLFKLVNPDFITIQEDYLMDKATVEYLEKALKRSKILHSEKVTADQEYQEMEMNYNIAKSNLEAARKTLELMNLPIEKIQNDNIYESISIYAPIDGHVDQLLVTSGQFIQRGMEAVSIINTDHLHLELRLFEKDLKYIKKGQLIEYRIPEVSDEILKAEVYLVGKSVDPTTRLIAVHAHVDHTDLTLIPGMFVEAIIAVD